MVCKRQMARGILGLLVLLSTSLKASESPCPRIQLSDSIKFSDNELRLICGDESRPEWKKVPLPESRHYLEVFLQDRGYHQPEFQITAGKLIVGLGERSFLIDIQVDPSPSPLDISRIWKVYGKPLTPSLLNEIERWATDELKKKGFACAVVKSTALPKSGRLLLQIQANGKRTVSDIEVESVSGIHDSVLRRYDAFSVGNVYDVEDFELTKKRLLAKGLLEVTAFSENCEKENQVKIYQRSIAGPPRIFRVGFGFNTEQLGVFRASFQNTRLGSQASWLEVSSFISAREQTLRTDWDWYYWPRFNRHSLRTVGSVTRMQEAFGESYQGNLKLLPSIQMEANDSNWSFGMGPTYYYTKTVVGKGPKDQSAIGLTIESKLISHDFELYDQSPRTGYQWNFQAIALEKDWGAPIRAKKFSLLSQYYWNLGNLGPPKWVLGFRSGIHTTLTPESLKSDTLSSQFRHYLGGASDLRGFSRKELPDKEGALSSVYASLELRLANGPIEKLQPFIFGDIGELGLEELSLQMPVYWSPGMGLRWESPLGPIRFTGAHGFLISKRDPALSHWQFYVTLGEEF